MSFPAPTRRAFLAGGIAVTLLPAPLWPSPAQTAPCCPKCRRKLSGVSTMNGEFIQFDPNGEQRQGKFFIARPGRVRFQYDPPMAISVVADGKSVMIHDKKLQTYDIYPLSQTPLRLLLDPNLDLSTSERVTNISVAPDLIEVELQDETRFSAGTLNLVFDRASSELRQWTVTDQQGLQTLVTLYNVELGNNLAPDLFKIDYIAATNASRDEERSGR
jgi:outer membrane lipoprotein-sorting protein